MVLGLDNKFITIFMFAVLQISIVTIDTLFLLNRMIDCKQKGPKA